MINQVHIVAGVSGGVHVDPWHAVTAEATQVDKSRTTLASIATEHLRRCREVLRTQRAGGGTKSLKFRL